MTAFMLDDADDEAIRAAADAARAHPISLAMVKRAALAGERPKDMPEPQTVPLPLGWRLNISCEEQPAGCVLHLSLSTPAPNETAPSWPAMQMVFESLGYSREQKIHDFWFERFTEAGEYAGVAMNVLVPA